MTAFRVRRRLQDCGRGQIHCRGAEEGPEVFHGEEYDLRERETGELMTDNLHFVFIEVGAFGRKEEELGSVMDKWMFVLKNMARLLDRPETLQERIFRKLFEAAQIAAMSHEEYVL